MQICHTITLTIIGYFLQVATSVALGEAMVDLGHGVQGLVNVA